MTGTPVSEDFLGLFAQTLIIDKGERFGARFDKFKLKYFYEADFMGYKHELKVGAEKQILKKLESLVHVMPDYRAELPPINYHCVPLKMPNSTRELYLKMLSDSVVYPEHFSNLFSTMAGREPFTAENAAVLVGKLRQISNGFLYPNDETDNAVMLNYEKILEAQWLVENVKRKGGVVVVYWFSADLERLREFIPQGKALTDSPSVVDEWNNGELPVLFLQPRSGGHGLQLEQGGHTIIWLGPEWSRDLWEQTNGRLWRKGQTEAVNVYTIETEGSIDREMTARVKGKANFDAMLLAHMAECKSAP